MLLEWRAVLLFWTREWLNCHRDSFGDKSDNKSSVFQRGNISTFFATTLGHAIGNDEEEGLHCCFNVVTFPQRCPHIKIEVFENSILSDQPPSLQMFSTCYVKCIIDSQWFVDELLAIRCFGDSLICTAGKTLCKTNSIHEELCDRATFY